ncbi:hypothetical protein [Achromobacter xylosoxidans]|nr:hypothetical protein [Achromobacter xylosoxidans]
MKLMQESVFSRAARTTRERRATWARGVIVAAMLSAALSACGGSDDDSSSPATATPPDTATPAASRHSLIIDLDGATYAAVRDGIAAGTLPNLARLQPQLAYSGGMAGTPGQQPTLDLPGWATLLTGTWANRHKVISSAPAQALRSATLFEILKTAGGDASGAAVASASLGGLLAADREAGFLDTLESCAADPAASDCVTAKAGALIEAGYGTVLAQYGAAKDAALDHGIQSPRYAGTLAQLDAAVGKLVAATGKDSGRQWLVLVTGNHGLSANSQDDGLPLLPESATFIGMNQAPTNADGIGIALPATLDELYRRASIADIAPTILQQRGALPAVGSYAMDGASLLGAAPVTQLKAAVADNNSASVNVVLSWTAPPQGTLSILRDGKIIASRLPAGTASYTDNQLGGSLTAKGTYQFSYTVVAGEGDAAVPRAIVSPPLSYVPPVPLAATLTNGLVSYYPFSSTLPPLDKQGNSVMGPAAADLPAAAGLVVPGPFAGTQGLLVDTNYVTTDGLEGYRLVPAIGHDIAQGATPQFTIGFWFKIPECVARSNVTVLANKNYVSGGNAGVAIGLFSSSGNQCGIAFNIGSGAGVRADGPTSPYTQITVNRWVYIAFSVDGVAKSMNMYVFDPVTGLINRVASGKSTGAVDMSKLAALPQWGIGEDGTGAYLMNKCNGSVRPPYTAGLCATAPTYQQMFGDLAMWNRVLTDSEMQSIFLSNKPLSTLFAN